MLVARSRYLRRGVLEGSRHHATPRSASLTVRAPITRSKPARANCSAQTTTDATTRSGYQRYPTCARHVLPHFDHPTLRENFGRSLNRIDRRAVLHDVKSSRGMHIRYDSSPLGKILVVAATMALLAVACGGDDKARSRPVPSLRSSRSTVRSTTTASKIWVRQPSSRSSWTTSTSHRRSSRPSPVRRSRSRSRTTARSNTRSPSTKPKPMWNSTPVRSPV